MDEIIDYWNGAGVGISTIPVFCFYGQNIEKFFLHKQEARMEILP